MVLKDDKCDKNETDSQVLQTKPCNLAAVLSLAAGALSIPLAFLSFRAIFILILFGLTVISALVLGIAALVRVAVKRGKLGGSVLAVLGICASLAGVICFFGYWITHFTLPT